MALVGLAGTSGRAGEGEPSFEITAGSNGLLSFSDSSTQMSLFAGMRVAANRWLQLGGTAAFRYQSGGGIVDTAFQGLVGPTFNLLTDSGLQQAWFVTPMLGVTTAQTTYGSVLANAATQFTMSLLAGKRFALSPAVAYAPAVGVVKELNFSANFIVEPIAISVFL